MKKYKVSQLLLSTASLAAIKLECNNIKISDNYMKSTSFSSDVNINNSQTHNADLLESMKISKNSKPNFESKICGWDNFHNSLNSARSSVPLSARQDLNSQNNPDDQFYSLNSAISSVPVSTRAKFMY